MSVLSGTFTVLLLSYLILVLGHLAAQIYYARRTHQRASRQPAAGAPGSLDCPPSIGSLPSVDVIIPCYNEDPLVLTECLRSVASQDYQGKLAIYLVDDGSRNRDGLSGVYDAYADDPRFTFILLPRNVGKRKAQVAAIRQSTGDLVINIDSDTTIQPDVARKLAAAMADPGVGAAMGHMVASNAKATWLTRMINMEYWIACNQERAAQAMFGAVICCCGPCAVYRRSVLLEVLDQYETQFFRGRPSDFGEDRHLTILILKTGRRTVYVPDAEAATLVPERIRPYLRQQLRWARSTYRDTLLAIRLLSRFGPYLTLDVIAQNVAPLLLGLTILTGLALVAATASIPWWSVAALTGLALANCSYGAWHNRTTTFFTFALHDFIKIGLLLPLKVYALCTLGNTNWGSRTIPATLRPPTLRPPTAAGATKLPRPALNAPANDNHGRNQEVLSQ
ncbi:chitooligosaccharide synthase NodC [Frankia sp. Cas3]|uniref:chitooligosaccharide synthase NodC n=1 Tax=Frankia sp. Cas3 TaxID=3073926 RepID=UPI003A0FC1D4